MKKAVLLSTILLGWVSCAAAGSGPAAAPRLEELSLRLSEPPGYFDTDNLITNEASFQHVLPVVLKHGASGGAYLGVGPGQNLTYIAHRKPELAVLIDVREDNRLLLLYLRSLFLESADRWEYLSALLGRSVKAPRDTAAGAADLVEAFRQVSPDRDFFEEVFERSWRRLRAETPRLVAGRQRDVLHRMASEFFHHGLELRFRSHGRPARFDYPTLARLLLETDGQGRRAHFLESEEHYRFLRRMHEQERIVPVVGDLAGPDAMPGIGALLRERQLDVTAFYVSNVEFYLLGDGRFDAFVDNVALLPLHPRAVVIRSYFGYGFRHPLRQPGYRVTSLSQHISSFLENHRRRPYGSYADLVLRDYLE